MERLTSNKSTSDMNMLELAYNSCYADEKGNARYRDYELDIDIRKLIKMLIKDMCNEDLFGMSDEEIDEYMAEMLSVEMDSQIGLLALFYRNLLAMAGLRERLKSYEDLEEQGRLLKLSCKVGDKVYRIRKKESVIEMRVLQIYCRKNCDGKTRIWFDTINIDNNEFENSYFVEDIGKTVFLAKSEAETKLKELRGGTDEAVK